MSRRLIISRSLQVEGRGNGIKTCVVNNVEIAKALERPPECKAKQNTCVLALVLSRVI